MSDFVYYRDDYHTIVVKAFPSISIPSRTKTGLEREPNLEEVRHWENFFKNMKIVDESIYRLEDIKRAINLVKLEVMMRGGRKDRAVVIISKAPYGVLLFTASIGKGDERQITEVAVSPLVKG
jgi:hypothetical protein